MDIYTNIKKYLQAQTTVLLLFRLQGVFGVMVLA